MKNITRSSARRRAFALIFAGIGKMEDISEQINIFITEHPEYEPHIGYITKVAAGACEKASEIEEIVNQNITDEWRFNRLSKICRAVLMLSIYEMKYVEDVPPRVAINEAVEIAKKYGDDNEPKLINGILGSVMKSNV